MEFDGRPWACMRNVSAEPLSKIQVGRFALREFLDEFPLAVELLNAIGALIDTGKALMPRTQNFFRRAIGRHLRRAVSGCRMLLPPLEAFTISDALRLYGAKPDGAKKPPWIKWLQMSLRRLLQHFFGLFCF